MRRSRLRRRVLIPNVSTNKSQTKVYEFIKGLNTNSTNDNVNPDQWRYITDARENLVGRWDTRKGNDFLSVPIGEIKNVGQEATTFPGDFGFNEYTQIAQPLVATANGRLTSLEARLKTADATGTVLLALFTDVAGAPGKQLFMTSIAASAVTTSYQWLKGRSITCPDIVSGTTYWVVMYVQTGGTSTYQVSTTSATPTGGYSINKGMSFIPQSYGFNVRMNTAPATPVKGLLRVKRPNAGSFTFLAVGTSLYSVNETTGVTTAIDTGLDINATYVRFDYVADTLRYVQGTTKPRKYDFTTASSVTAAPESASAIISHKGLEFFISADDNNKVFFTNFGIYDTFTSTDFIYVPSPKTADPSVGFSKLNGALYIHTRNNKYVLTGSENASFSLDNAIGQKGTFSQESVAYDEDFIYLASDDGIYQFNGADENNITVKNDGAESGVLDWWVGLTNKRNTVLQLHNNRLYVFYTPNGEATNSRCKVYNTLYGIWESDDVKTYVNHAFSGADQSSYFIQASNRVGMLMLAEQDTNDYVTMDEPIEFELRTSYQSYGTPAQYKRVPYYRPHFDAQQGNYSIQCGWAYDYSDSPTYYDINLQAAGPRFDTGLLYDTGVMYGGVQQINPTDWSPVIPGEWRRLQNRYKHIAAREPVTFDGHILTLETQRIT